METVQKKPFHATMLICIAVILSLIGYSLLEVFTPYNISPSATSTATTSPKEIPHFKDTSSNTGVTSSTAQVPGKGKCSVGGCSGEICSDTPGIVSNCIYRPLYACYKTAGCERQRSGDCGWTQSTALLACLSQKSTIDAPGAY